MLKNVQDAKFAKTLVPISKVVLTADDQKDLSFEAFFTHILMHERDARAGTAQHHAVNGHDDRPPGDEGQLQLPSKKPRPTSPDSSRFSS